MKPRVVPTKKGITDSALAAAGQYGIRGRYRQKVDRAQTVALGYLDQGLPSDFDPIDNGRGQLPATASTDFWIYVLESHGIYLGFAESARGEWLRLVAFQPSDTIDLDDMIELTKNSM